VCELGPHETKDLVLVISTPMQASTGNLLAKLQIAHIADDDEPKTFVEKRVGPVIERRLVPIEKTLEVLLCGKLQNPVLMCLKSITNAVVRGATVIPIAAKLNETVQKFKIPFKAIHASTPETEFEFIFIKSVLPEACEGVEETLEHKQFVVFDCMTFFCLPAVLKVGPNAPALLSIQL